MLAKFHSLFKRVYFSKDFKYRVFRSGTFLGISGGFENGLRFVRNMLLARILLPDAFGQMAMILAVNTFFESFTQIGVKEAIIQNPLGHERPFLNGAFWVSFGRSVLLFSIGYIAAPFIAAFYNDLQLVFLLRVSFFAILFNGLISPCAYLALKKMKYLQWGLTYHGGSICGILITVVLSFFWRNTLALVVGYVAEAAMRFLLSYILCSYKPDLTFRKESLRSLLSFSGGMFGLPILMFIFSKADIFVIGKLCSKENLGLYSMALSLAQLPSMLITMFISPVLLPAFSEISKQKERVAKGILKTTNIFVKAGTPFLTFTFCYGADILKIVYGPKYSTVSIPFKILCTTLILIACNSPLVTALIAIGRPQLYRSISLLRVFLMLMFVYPLVKWFGLNGAAMAGLGAMVISYLIQIYQHKQLFQFKINEYGYLFIHACFYSFPIILIFLITRWFNSSSYLNLFFGISGCVVSYSLLIGPKVLSNYK